MMFDGGFRSGDETKTCAFELKREKSILATQCWPGTNFGIELRNSVKHMPADSHVCSDEHDTIAVFPAIGGRKTASVHERHPVALQMIGDDDSSLHGVGLGI